MTESTTAGGTDTGPLAALPPPLPPRSARRLWLAAFAVAFLFTAVCGGGLAWFIIRSIPPDLTQIVSVKVNYHRTGIKAESLDITEEDTIQRFRDALAKAHGVRNRMVAATPTSPKLEFTLADGKVVHAVLLQYQLFLPDWGRTYYLQEDWHPWLEEVVSRKKGQTVQLLR